MRTVLVKQWFNFDLYTDLKRIGLFSTKNIGGGRVMVMLFRQSDATRSNICIMDAIQYVEEVLRILRQYDDGRNLTFNHLHGRAKGLNTAYVKIIVKYVSR